MREAFAVIRFLTVLLWPFSVWASGATLGSVMTGHSASDWGALFLLTTVSGLVALLNRVRKSMEADALMKLGLPFNQEDKMLLGWKWFAVFHMAGSYILGLVVFMIAEHQDWDSYVEALGITLAAWIGAKGMDILAGAWTDRLQGLVSALGGAKPPNPGP